MIKFSFYVICVIGYVICQTDVPATISFTGISSDPVEKLLVINPNSKLTITLGNIPKLYAFAILQTHSFQSEIILSDTPSLVNQTSSVKGTNIGLCHLLTDAIPTFYLTNPNNLTLNVLAAVIAYPFNSPIPGGANMEFPTPIAPYLNVENTPTIIKVDAQPASLQSGAPKIKYQVYHRFLLERDYSEEVYFEGIRTFMKRSTIDAFGREVPSPWNGPELRRYFNSYRGIGHVFTVVATWKNQSAVYVPAVSYGCNVTTSICEEEVSPQLESLFGLIFFLGLFLCSNGHTYFKTGQFLHGLFSGSLISFIFVSLLSEKDSLTETVFEAVLIGIAIGIVWIAIWSYFGLPIVSMLIPNFFLGFMFAAATYYSGAADISLMQDDFNYWVIFATLLLCISMWLPVMQHQANILACSALGAFCAVATLSHFSGAYLHYIVINVIRRAVDPEFSTAIIDPPIQALDWALIFIWGLLFTVGYYRQSNEQRGKPPFPPPPYLQRRNMEPYLLRSEREPLVSRAPPEYRTIMDAHPTGLYTSTG